MSEIIISIAICIITVGITFIYDARKIVVEKFSVSDRNGAVRVLKITGFVLSLVGSFMIILSM